jgi:hypothetical protein
LVQAGFDAADLHALARSLPVFIHELVDSPAPRNPGGLTTKERITLYRGLYNIKRWTNNLTQLVRMFVSAQAKVPADGDAATAVDREVRDAEGNDADDETGPVAIGGKAPDAVDDIGADGAATPQAVEAEIDDDEAKFWT